MRELFALLRDLPAPQPGSDGARKKAEEILNRAEFQGDKPNIMQRAIDWLGRRLSDLFGATAPGGANSAFSIAVGVIAVGVLVVVVSRLRRGGAADREDRDGPELSVEEVRPPADWLREAEAFERANDWKGALRARYRWLVASLAEAGALSNVPGRTTGELRAEFAANEPSAAASFAAATDLFELVWYGSQPTGAEDNERFRSQASRVLEAVGVRR